MKGKFFERCISLLLCKILHFFKTKTAKNFMETLTLMENKLNNTPGAHKSVLKCIKF